MGPSSDGLLVHSLLVTKLARLIKRTAEEDLTHTSKLVIAGHNTAAEDPLTDLILQFMLLACAPLTINGSLHHLPEASSPAFWRLASLAQSLVGSSQPSSASPAASSEANLELQSILYQMLQSAQMLPQSFTGYALTRRCILAALLLERLSSSVHHMRSHNRAKQSAHVTRRHPGTYTDTLRDKSYLSSSSTTRQLHISAVDQLDSLSLPGRTFYLESWSKTEQSLVIKILLHLHTLHCRAAAKKPIIELFHISKAGGTSLCQLAQINNCSTEDFSRRWNCLIRYTNMLL